VARKRRTRPHPGRQPRPPEATAGGRRSAARTPPPPPPQVIPPDRLPWTLTRRQKIAVVGIFLTGVGSFIGLVDRFETFDDYPFLPGLLTVACLAFSWLLEKEAIERRGSRVLRFAGFGVLAPVAVSLVGFAALTPISVLFGLTVYRLGLGSMTPPAVVAVLGTFLVVGMAGDAGQADATSPTVFAYIVATACIWPGTGVLLITRGRTT